MHQLQRPVYTRAFAAALWLVAKGFEPEAAEMARDGSGGILFRFPSAAQPALGAYHDAKDQLNTLSLDARGRRQ